MDDTIASISTTLGVGAISIIRVSGNDAIKIVNKIFKGYDLDKVPTHTIHYGHIYENDTVIDEVLVTVMKKPKTYTTEDVVEINTHGGIAPTNKVLELLLRNGARLAEPGEFTKRAFLNGRIDLVEAEGIMDLINAKTEAARRLAVNQVDGRVSNLIKELRQEIIEILANIEVNIDYPEYEDILLVTKEMIVEKKKLIEQKIKKILKESENSKIIKEGIKTVVVGRPNVGKSSILNNLLNEEKAIVTEIEGTTRDIVEGSILINGILFHIIDTAGIRKTKNIVEKIGVEKSLKMIEEADLIILVLNNNESLTEEDIELITKTKNKKRIIFINKNDLKTRLEKEKIKEEIVVEGNTVSADGLVNLKNKIIEMFNLEQLENKDLTYLSNARQISILKETLTLIEEIDQSLKEDMPIDIIAIDLKKIWELLGQIIGENYSDELIDQLFSQFCLGK